MSISKFTSSLVASALVFAGVALAQTAGDRAVQEAAGKLTVSGGTAGLDGHDGSAVWDAAASWVAPLGNDYGLQADLWGGHAFGDGLFGGQAQLFRRDPGSYLFGVTGGVGSAGGDATSWFIGPEAEFYLGRVTLEAWGGFLRNDYDWGGHDDTGFVDVGLGYYATDDLRLSMGGRSVGGEMSGYGGLEWLLSGGSVPVSFTTQGDVGENGYRSISAGLTLYFGPEAGRSLISQHRQEHRNKKFDMRSLQRLVNKAAAAHAAGAVAACTVETACSSLPEWGNPGCAFHMDTTGGGCACLSECW
jgi:hypothetical protein